MTEGRFADRRQAGRSLAEALHSYAGRGDLVVLGLPRGGVPVAREVAQALSAPLDVFCVRKLGVPGHPELAFGAVAGVGVRVLNDDVIRVHHVTATDIDVITERERETIRRQEIAFRSDQVPTEPAGRIALIVDDGLATGATMRAAAQAAGAAGASRVVCAVPVAPAGAAAAFADVCDEFVAVLTPTQFRAVGQYYDDFSEITDEEVRRALTR
jgi:putative phosphoribosyl transferase